MEVQGIVEVIKRADKDIKSMLKDKSSINEESLNTLALRLSSISQMNLDYANYLMQWLSKRGKVDSNFDNLIYKSDVKGAINSSVWHNVLYKVRKGLDDWKIEEYVSNVLNKRKGR